MRCVVSVVDERGIGAAAALGADLVEVRLDLLDHPPDPRLLAEAREVVPLILTLRTTAEGGRFDGSTDRFIEILEPLVRPGDLIDIEAGHAAAAPRIRHLGAGVIASHHGGSMHVPGELVHIGHRLRTFGDIPKIVVTPGSEQDVLDLCSFTIAAEKPICTGVMGSRYRYARVLLPLFGSELVYCHAGRPTAEGQYHIADFRRIWALLVS